MISKYYVEVRQIDGTRFGLFNNYLQLSYVRILDEIGIAKILLKGDHPILPDLADQCAFIIWRWNPTVDPDPVVEFAGVFQGIIYKQDSNGSSLAELIIPDGNILLRKAINAYYGNVANFSKFTLATISTIINTLIQANFGIIGAGVRLIYPTFADGGNVGVTGFWPSSPTYSYNNEFKNVLTEIQGLVKLVDAHWYMSITSAEVSLFQLIPVSGGLVGNPTILDYQRSNLIRSELDLRRTNEITKVLVGGQGVVGDRQTVVRTSPTHNSQRQAELFVNADNISTTAELNDIGDRTLEEYKFIPNFTFSTLQVPGTLYGLDYNLGSVLRVFSGEISLVQRVTEVTVTITPEREEINLGLANISQPNVGEIITITETVTVVRI